MKAVIGLGFGDEGKGLVTSYLTDKLQNPDIPCVHTPTVIRFSGGQQAGHNVTITKNGKKISHTFSNFGSGTLQGARTVWSKFCTFDPIGMLNEKEILKSKGIDNPVLLIDRRCPVTTPFDIHYNRVMRRYANHGTVGVGVGATIEREKNFYSLTAGDLLYPKIAERKFKIIQDYYASRTDFTLSTRGYNTVEASTRFMDEVIGSDSLDIQEHPDDLYNQEGIIFEGAQGLMLDPRIGFFPHVTRISTGTKNILKIMKKQDRKRPLEIFLVTRAYQTRHGEGPKTGGHRDFKNPHEKNRTEEYQGNFRTGVLDLSMISYAIMKEDYIRDMDDSRLNLVITCTDCMKDGFYLLDSKNNEHKYNTVEEFANEINKVVAAVNVFISDGPELTNIKQIK